MYTYKLDQYYQVLEDGEYPIGNSDKKVVLHKEDILTGQHGRYTKHNGIMCGNIKLTTDQIHLVKKPIKLKVA